MEESSNQEENNSTNIEEEEDSKEAGGDNMTKVRDIQNYPLSLSIDLPFFEDFPLPET